VENLYFDLTRELNAQGPVAALASGQAVVYYRLAMMSKDGDWILKETPTACRRVLEVLTRHGARYRPSAPLDVRWLAAGWSSHFEFFDSRGRRIRCDFIARPPRVPVEELAALFTSTLEPMLVVPIEPLIRLKQTQRAKDYPVIGELARLLPAEREIELTTDPDRILALAQRHGGGSKRRAVQAAAAGDGLSREEVVVELAREANRMQAEDHARLERFRAAAEPFLREFQASGISALHLPEAHRRAVELALRALPFAPLATGDPSHGTAQ
jgi:hypothetical protein